MSENRSLKIIVVILSVLLVGSSLLLYEKIKLQDERINSLSTFSENQKETIDRLEQKNTQLELNLSATEKELKNETETRKMLEKQIINLTMVSRTEYAVFAVDENEKGHLIPLEVIIKSGKGNLFLNMANVLFDETLQSSAQIAVLVAREISRKSLFDKDVLINIEAPVQAQTSSISGGSAGAAMTLAVTAALQDRRLRNDVYITGTINEDHTIGKIGGARAKAFAAKESGAVLFLVPKGQITDVGNVGINVREVADIEEAVKFAME